MLHVITILVQLSIEVSGSGYFIKFATKFRAERFSRMICVHPRNGD